MEASPSTAPPITRVPDAEPWPNAQTNSQANQAWAKKNSLMLDGGGTRGYASLLMLRFLMTRIAYYEAHHQDGPHLSSFYPLDTGQGGHIPSARRSSTLPIHGTGNGVAVSPLRHASTFSSPPLVPSRSQTEHLAEQARKELENRRDFLPSHYFDYIGGTSTGGLNATMLGRLRMSVEESIHRYPGMAVTIFGKKRISLRGIYRARYKATPMEDVVRNLVNERVPPNAPRKFHRFGSPEDLCRTVLVAKEIDPNGTSEKPYLFRSYDLEYSGNDGIMDPRILNPGPAHDCEIYEAARATSAAPMYFKPMRIGRSEYSDGGILYNDPSMRVFWEIMCKENCLQPTDPCPLALVLSLGTGLQRNKRDMARGLIARHPKIRRLTGMLHRFRSSLTSTASTEESMRDNARWGGFTYHKWTGGDEVGAVRLDDVASFQKMEKWVEDYMARPEVSEQLEITARMLVDHRRRRIREDPDRWRRFSTCISFKCLTCPEVAGTKAEIRRHVELVHGDNHADSVYDKLHVFHAWKGSPWHHDESSI